MNNDPEVGVFICHSLTRISPVLLLQNGSDMEANNDAVEFVIGVDVSDALEVNDAPREFETQMDELSDSDADPDMEDVMNVPLPDDLLDRDVLSIEFLEAQLQRMLTGNDRGK